MTSAKALAGSSAMPCAQCGFGPSQSFRAEPSPTSTASPYRNHLASPPFFSNHSKFKNSKASKWPVAFGKMKGPRRAVSMEYGGNMIRPELTGEREIVTGQQMLQQLRKQLLEAINMEDYLEAARVRDFISIVVSQDPVLSTSEALERAILEERYDDAAKLRDELKDLTPPEEETASFLGDLGNSSDTLTQNIRVRVKSGYVVERSDPLKQQYFFAYRIRITNEGARTVQLLHRHWVITDATGRTEEVRGPGVIGEQPVLRAGHEFEYTSACPLRTPAGKMEGEYQMIHVDSDDPAPFAVKIGPFALRAEEDEESATGFQ